MLCDDLEGWDGRDIQEGGHICVLVLIHNVVWRAKSLQSSPTLCDPMDCSLPGSVHRIPQIRILVWGAISSSRGSSRPRN